MAEQAISKAIEAAIFTKRIEIPFLLFLFSNASALSLKRMKALHSQHSVKRQRLPM